MDDLKSALARVIDVRMLTEHLTETWRTDETAVCTALANAVTTLRAAEREITARLKIGPGQCRASHTDDDGPGAYVESRCELDAGHDGPHEDGDWGWKA
jgi:hypothetical protein